MKYALLHDNYFKFDETTEYLEEHHSPDVQVTVVRGSDYSRRCVGCCLLMGIEMKCFYDRTVYDVLGDYLVIARSDILTSRSILLYSSLDVLARTGNILKFSVIMSLPGAVIDLSDDIVEISEPSKKRKVENPVLEKVWIAFHQLECSYDCIGDFEKERRYLSHVPTMFDKTILGVFVTRGAANKCANEYWRDNHGDDDEDDDDSDVDFVGEGKYYDGADSGNVNTFSERVVVEMKTITNK